MSRLLVAAMFALASFNSLAAAVLYTFVTDTVAEHPCCTGPEYAISQLNRLSVTLTASPASLSFHETSFIPITPVIDNAAGVSAAHFFGSAKYSNGVFTGLGPFRATAIIGLNQSGDGLLGSFFYTNGETDITMTSGPNLEWSGVFGTDVLPARLQITGHWALVAVVSEPGVLPLLLLSLLAALYHLYQSPTAPRRFASAVRR